MIPSDLAAQLHQTEKWLLAGADEHDVTEAIAQAWPGTDPAALITAALDRISRSAHFDPDLVIGFTLEATRELYHAMREIGDFSGALKAVKQLHDFAMQHAPCLPAQDPDPQHAPSLSPSDATPTPSA